MKSMKELARARIKSRKRFRRKVDQVLDYIQKYPGCTREQIATGTGISYGQVIRYTRDLGGAGKVRGVMVGGRVWKLYPGGSDLTKES